jgi:DNA damage-binding protein 1
MRGVSYFYLVEQENEIALERVATNYECHWMHTVAPINRKLLFGTDAKGNLFSMHRIAEQSNRLEMVGRFGVGETINRIIKGSLISRLAEVETATQEIPLTNPSAMAVDSVSGSSSSSMQMDSYDTDSRIKPYQIFGTINGTLGVIAPLTQSQSEFLRRLETQLQSQTFAVGKLSHSKWRSFKHLQTNLDLPAQHFIDGDLIESFLNLPEFMQSKIATALGTPLEKIKERVDDLTRIH